MKPDLAKKHLQGFRARLSELGFDCPLLAGVQYSKHMISEVGYTAVSAVLKELSRKDAGVRRRLVGLHSVYPKHEEFMAKIAEVDAAGLAKALKRLSFMAQTKVYLFWRKSETS